MNDVDHELDYLINCEICNEELDKPVILPCFKSICLKHIIPSADSMYKCDICNRFHKIPEQGFTFDKRAAKLIEIKQTKQPNGNYIDLNKINLGTNNRDAKKACDQLDELLKQSDKFLVNPQSYITEYFNELKQKIDIQKEEIIRVLEQNYAKVSNELTDLKNQCCANSYDKLEDFNISIQDSKIKLEDWRLDLNVPDFDFNSKWENISSLAKQEFETFNKFFSKVKNSLLMNKEYQFKSKQIEDNNFGILLLEPQIEMGIKNEVDIEQIPSIFNPLSTPKFDPDRTTFLLTRTNSNQSIYLSNTLNDTVNELIDDNENTFPLYSSSFTSYSSTNYNKTISNHSTDSTWG